MVINVQFHLFQEVINLFTVADCLENTNQMILVMIDRHRLEVQDIPETIEVQDIPVDDRGSRNSRDNDDNLC